MADTIGERYIPRIDNPIQAVVIGTAWLGTAVDLRALALDRLDPEDFTGTDRELFRALAAGNTYIEREAQMTEDGRKRLAAIQGVILGKPTLREFTHWLEQLKKASARRRLALKVEEWAKAAQTDKDPETLSADIIQDIIAIRDYSSQQAIVDIAEGVTAVRASLEQWKQGKKYVDSVPFYIEALDRVLGGVKRGHVVTLAARPGMGKTQLALQISMYLAKHNQAVGRQASVLWFSAEMTRDELVSRLAQCMSGVSAEWLEEGHKMTGRDVRGMPIMHPTTPADFEAFSTALDTIATLPIRIDDSAGPSTQKMLYRARAESAQHAEGLDLVVFDYLELAGDDGNRGDNETNRIGRIMRGLKRLAKELKVPVMVIAQLSREVERRASRLPELSDLRSSGDIEALSNQVMFIYRPDYYKRGTEYMDKSIRQFAETFADRGGNCAISIAKNRNRKANTMVVMQFDAEITRFSESKDTKVLTVSEKSTYKERAA